MERELFRELVERVSRHFTPFMEDRMVFMQTWLEDGWLSAVQGRSNQEAEQQLSQWIWACIVAPYINCDPRLTYDQAEEFNSARDELFEATGEPPSVEQLRNELNTGREAEYALSIEQVEEMMRMFPGEVNSSHYQKVRRRHGLSDDPL